MAIKNSERFTYLGSCISDDGKSTTEIKCRIGKVGAAFGKMFNVWTSKKIDLKRKLNIYHTTVTSILL